MSIKALAYLLPFSIELPEKIDLGDGLIVRKITEAEKSEKKRNNLLSMRSSDFEKLKYCVELTIHDFVPGVNPWIIGSGEHPYKEVEEKIGKAILAFRLFGSGAIGYNEFDVFKNQKNSGEEILDATISRITHFHGQPYLLEESQSENFIGFYNSIKNLEEIDFAGVAMERFRQLYERDKSEDRLIDLFVALESLFGINQELKYRLSINLASYLHSTGNKRREAFKKIGEAYNLRSKIVHGSTFNQTMLEETISYMEDCFREAINKILMGKQGRDRKYFLNYVEERVFGII